MHLCRRSAATTIASRRAKTPLVLMRAAGKAGAIGRMRKDGGRVMAQVTMSLRRTRFEY